MMGDIYYPACGTEGADFMSRWCDRCKRDEAFRNEEGDSCSIAASTFCGPVEQWRYERGEPVCAAFEASDPGDLPFLKSAAVADLFPSSHRRPTQGERVRMVVSMGDSNAH
jgi:hypothetical protein